MARENIDQRRQMVGKVLNAGISIGPREAKVRGLNFTDRCGRRHTALTIRFKLGNESLSGVRARLSEPANPLGTARRRGK